RQKAEGRRQKKNENRYEWVADSCSCRLPTAPALLNNDCGAITSDAVYYQGQLNHTRSLQLRNKLYDDVVQIGYQALASCKFNWKTIYAPTLGMGLNHD